MAPKSWTVSPHLSNEACHWMLKVQQIPEPSNPTTSVRYSSCNPQPQHSFPPASTPILTSNLSKTQGFVIRLLTVVNPPPPPGTVQSPPPAEPSEDDRVLQTVFVQSGNGTSVTMNQVRLLTTVEEFREQYSRRQGQNPDACRLIYSGKELEDMKAGSGECGYARS